ncbi:hypothetical protein ABS751_00185 [Bacillus subtilis]
MKNMTISLKARVNPEHQKRLDKFIEAFNQLPDKLKIQLSLDGGKSWLTDAMVNTKKILHDTAFKEPIQIKDLSTIVLHRHPAGVGIPSIFTQADTLGRSLSAKIDEVNDLIKGIADDVKE